LAIPLITLHECQEIAVTVDGADEVDPQLRLIKGGGGALLREKIVASATKQMIVVGDASKRVERLGRFPLPVEVIKFAEALVAKRISALGAEVKLRLGADDEPYVSDENNHILDCSFGEIRDPDGLSRELSDMPGVVEHGLFIGMASIALFARGSEITELRR
jgi:ribose 5-phosphate isomerase A